MTDKPTDMKALLSMAVELIAGEYHASPGAQKLWLERSREALSKSDNLTAHVGDVGPCTENTFTLTLVLGRDETNPEAFEDLRDSYEPIGVMLTRYGEGQL